MLLIRKKRVFNISV